MPELLTSSKVADQRRFVIFIGLLLCLGTQACSPMSMYPRRIQTALERLDQLGGSALLPEAPSRVPESVNFHRPIDDDTFRKAGPALKELNLRYLYLDGSRVSDASIPLILEFSKIKVLNLVGTQVTIEGLVMLEQLPDLETLVISNTFSDVELGRLTRIMPTVKVLTRPH